MKNLKITLILGFICLTTNAQKSIEKNINYQNQYIDIDVKFASFIEVKTWDKSDIYFKADLTTEDGKYLDLYTLDIDERSSTISIISNAKPIFKAFRKEWNKTNSKSNNGYYNSGDRYKFNYVIYVPKNAKFKISSINGSLKSDIINGDFEADLINGDIDIAAYSGDLKLNTINGEIDLKIVDAQLVAETIHGDIYADEKLKFTSSNRHIGQKLAGSLGKASNQLQLSTINGNMYLR